jgi:SAM-dependent methyltransferase
MSTQDAFGQMVMDFYKGEEDTSEIIERDDGMIAVGKMGPRSYFAGFTEWESYLQTAIKEHLIGRVMDIGCGAGRVLLYAQEKGLEAVGIDVSPLAVEVCKLRGAKHAHAKSLTQWDASLGIFDTITMVGHNFGLVSNVKRARWLLQRWKNLTSPSAKIIAHSMNPHTTENPIHLAYHERNRARGRHVGQIRLRVRHKTLIGDWLDYLFVSPEEMGSIIHATGWRISEIIDSEETPSYIAILTKQN